MAVKNKTGNRETSTSRIPAYKNPKLAVSARVSNLLSRMTIEEKVAQLMGLWRGGLDEFDHEFLKDPEKRKVFSGKEPIQFILLSLV